MMTLMTGGDDEDDAVLSIDGKYPYYEKPPKQMPRILAKGFEHELRKAIRAQRFSKANVLSSMTMARVSILASNLK